MYNIFIPFELLQVTRERAGHTQIEIVCQKKRLVQFGAQ